MTSGCVPEEYEHRLLTISGGSVVSDSFVNMGDPEYGSINPILQAQDGTYLGKGISSPDSMDAFDQYGNVKWSVPGFTPMMATADGGLIAQSLYSGQYLAFDQNGAATGMHADLPTYSWTGERYATSGTIISALVLPPVDFADTFAAFAGGNPSGTGTAVRLVQAKMFAPFGIYDPLLDTEWALHEYEWMSSLCYYIPRLKPVLSFEMRKNATLGRFKNALATTNTIVAYLDHGMILANEMASGICFAGNNCLVDPALTNIDGIQYYPATGYTWDTSQASITPKARVVFLAGCGLTDDFVSFWNIQSGHALIVPVYLTAAEKTNFNVANAAWEWENILYRLSQGDTVDQAVAVGNATAESRGAAHRWTRIGDGNVRFETPSQ